MTDAIELAQQPPKGRDALSATQEHPIVEPIAIQTANEEGAPPSRGKFRITAILVALYLSLFVAALDQTIVATAIPTITAQLHSAAGYTWIGGAYALAKAAAGPLWAKFSDIWGRKPIVLLSAALFFASSIVCAAAQSMAALIAGRALQGVGGAGLMQMTVICIADLFSLRARSLVVGGTDVVWAVAAGVGPVLGGALAEHASWRWVFWINLPIAGTAFVLAALFLDVHDPRTRVADGLRAVDWCGSLAVLGLTLLLLLGLDFGGAIFPWSSPKVVCLIVFGALMSVFFVFSEKRLAKHPIMPLHLFKNWSNVASLLVGCIDSFVAVSFEYYLPFYFQSAKGASPVRSGLLILPLILVEAFTAVLTGLLIHRTGEYRLIMQVGLVMMTLGTGLYVMFKTDTSIATIIGFEVLTGVGVGMVFQPPMLALQALVSQDDTATATATMGFLKNIAAALSIILGSVVFQNSMDLREDVLKDAGLPAALLEQLSGKEAAANVELIGSIKDKVLQHTVKDAFSWSLRNMWVMYTAFSACGVIASLFVSRVVLSTEHTETKTGLKKQKADDVVSG